MGVATLWLAVGIGDMGLSLAVILNAMRLSLIKDKNIG
jgi:Cd2+/Zn2+-exporting ATPase